MDWRIVDPLIENALQEDLSWGDATSDNLIDPKQQSNLEIKLKQDGVVAGLPVAERVFQAIDPKISWKALAHDGEKHQSGTILAKVTGSSQSMLKAERLALNFLQRLSGVATLTERFVAEARAGSTDVRVVDTRKTTPGLRYLEKYAVRMGGGNNHRYNLSDAVMLKDNHLAMVAQSGKSLQTAVQELKFKIPHTMRIEIEIDSLDQLEEVMAAGADIVLLDNMSCPELIRAVEIAQGRVLLEASGGVNLKTIRAIAETGVDLISVGALTHSATSLDISLDYSIA